MKKILFALPLFALAGCQTGTGNQMAKYAALAVTAYCTQPEAARVGLRTLVAQAIVPNSIEIHCAGDE